MSLPKRYLSRWLLLLEDCFPQHDNEAIWHRFDGLLQIQHSDSKDIYQPSLRC